MGRNPLARMVVTVASMALAGTGCSGDHAQPGPSVPAIGAGASPPTTAAAAEHQPLVSQVPARADAASLRVKVGTAPPRVGDRYRVTETIRAANGPKSPRVTDVPRSKLEGTRVVVEEVLAVAGGRKTRWRVHVMRDERTLRKHGRGEQTSSPLAGETCLVWYEGGQLRASRQGGAPLSPQVLRLLRGKYGPTEKKWRTLFDVLPAREFEIGRTLELSPAALKALTRETFVLAAMKITLRSVDAAKRVAHFEHEIATHVPLPGGDGKLPFVFTGGFDASLEDGVFGRQVLEGSAEYEQDGHPCVAERNITRVIEQLPRAPEPGSPQPTP